MTTIPLTDWTGRPVLNDLRTAERVAGGEHEPLADPAFARHVTRISTATERADTTARMLHLRDRTRSAA